MVELNREELYQELEEMENDLRLYPIEEGLEDEIIDYINGKELSENEKSFPKFNQLSVSSEIEQGFSCLSVKLTL